jgi:hypothetical protein
VYRAEAECHLRLDGSRLLTPPWGLEGGHPGACGAFRFGEGVEPFVGGAGSLSAGETSKSSPLAQAAMARLPSAMSLTGAPMAPPRQQHSLGSGLA